MMSQQNCQVFSVLSEMVHNFLKLVMAVNRYDSNVLTDMAAHEDKPSIVAQASN